MATPAALGKVGDFAVYLAKDDPDGSVDFDTSKLVHSNEFLANKKGIPTVIHFYDGG